MVKACSRCGEVKPLDEFHRHKGHRDGRGSHCKICIADANRRYREANRERIAEWQRRYREDNPEKKAERDRRYYQENRDRIVERVRIWREENSDKYLSWQRQHYAENRDEILEKNRIYREENRDYCSSISRKWDSQTKSVTETAGSKSGRWSEVEIAILLADDGQTLTAKALALGRTYSSCLGKLKRLREARVAN